MPTNHQGNYITNSGWVHSTNTWLQEHGFPIHPGPSLEPVIQPNIYLNQDGHTIIHPDNALVHETEAPPQPMWQAGALNPAPQSMSLEAMAGSGGYFKPIPKKPVNKNKLYNIPFYEAFRTRIKGKKHKGEIGLEIECEGVNLASGMVDHWLCHSDNSLRAVKDSPPQEYVLRAPVDRKEVSKVLSYLSKKLQEAGSELVYSHRTSVHVHVNCQDLTIKEIYQYWCLYTIFEEILVSFSGPDRPGNLFCLSSKQAEYQVKQLEVAIQQENFTEVFNDNIRYTSCNMASLGKFGSMEFRSMRGTVDQELIQTWVDLLLILKDKALEYNDPQDIVKDFQSLNSETFLKKIFGHRKDIMSIFLGYEDRHKLLWDGMRLMRDVAYAIPVWEKKKDDEKKDLSNDEESDVRSGDVVDGYWESQQPSYQFVEYIDIGVFVMRHLISNNLYLFNYNNISMNVDWVDSPWALSARSQFLVNDQGEYLNAVHTFGEATMAPIWAEL